VGYPWAYTTSVIVVALGRRRKYMIRKIISIFAGAILFITLAGIIIGIFAKSGTTPVGQLIQSVLEKGSLKNFTEFATSDEGFSLMSQAFNFMGFFILPLISLVAGFLTGWISKTKGWLFSIIAVGPPAIFLMGYCSSLTSVFSIMICILLAAIGGYIANTLFPVKRLKH